LTQAASETYSELLGAHKELAEKTDSASDKLAYLSQASRLVNQCLELYNAANLETLKCEEINGVFLIDHLKWMLSHSWKLGINSY
jgi:hypothetical protein